MHYILLVKIYKYYNFLTVFQLMSRRKYFTRFNYSVCSMWPWACSFGIQFSTMEVRAVCTEEELAQHRKWKWINFQKPHNRSWHSFCLLVWSGRFYFWPDPVFLSGSGSDNLLANLKDKIPTQKLLYCGKIYGQYFLSWNEFFPVKLIWNY